MYRTDFGTLWEKAKVGWSERTALKHVYYQVRNRSPVHVGCMRQVLGAGALEWPRGMGWRGKWERGSGCGTHVNPWLIHASVWQKPPQHCKVISLQLIKEKKMVPIPASRLTPPIPFPRARKLHSYEADVSLMTMHILQKCYTVVDIWISNVNIISCCSDSLCFHTTLWFFHYWLLASLVYYWIPAKVLDSSDDGERPTEQESS